MTKSFFHVTWLLQCFRSVLWWEECTRFVTFRLQGTLGAVCICKAELSKATLSKTLSEITSRKREKLAEQQGWPALLTHQSLSWAPRLTVAVCHEPGQTTLLILISSQEQRAHLFLAFFNCVVITHLQNK